MRTCKKIPSIKSIKKLAKLDKKDQKNIRKGVDKLPDLYYINISNNYYYQLKKHKYIKRREQI